MQTGSYQTGHEKNQVKKIQRYLKKISAPEKKSPFLSNKCKKWTTVLPLPYQQIQDR